MTSTKLRIELAKGLMMTIGLAGVDHLKAAEPPDALERDNDDHPAVVINMTETLQAFCFGRQQAQQLARQTAAFGTLGLMTTIAAVGISNRPKESLAARRDHTGGHIDRRPAELHKRVQTAYTPYRP